MEELQIQDIPGIILLGTIGMLLPIGFMGLFILMYQKKLLKEKQLKVARELEYQNQMIHLEFQSQEQERKRIGADIHDSLGSLLWGAKINANYIQRSVSLSGEPLASLNELNHILDESIHAVRRISWELSPDAFSYSGLSESVMKLCNQFDGKTMKIVFQDEQKCNWNDDRALQVFRIIQELVSNALKHSEATQLKVSLAWQATMLDVLVRDNGKGMQHAEKKEGVGLWNVQNRTKQLNAEIHMGNSPMGTGTEIKLQVPL